MYCQKCGGGRVVVEMDSGGSLSHEICDECKGSGLIDKIDIRSEQIGYAMKKHRELVVFEITGFPVEWYETGVRAKAEGDRLFIRLGRELTPDGQPKANGVRQAKRILDYDTKEENG